MDPTLEMPGMLTNPDEPLFRLRIPNIQTLISRRVENERPEIGMVGLQTAVESQKFVSKAIGREDVIGITIDTSVPGLQIGPVMTENQPVLAQSVGKQLPRTYEEARNNLSLIVPGRAGKRTNVYKLEDLKAIARNLNLPSTGNKETIANTIVTAVTRFFGSV
jgi:hypothetical protein